MAVFLVFVLPHSSHALSPDSRGYLTLAHHFGGAYLRSEATLKSLSVLRTPVYPLMAGAVLAVRDSVSLLVFMQLVVGAATACIAAVFARELVGPRAGLAAGLVVALDPASVLISNYVLPEAVFTLLLFAGAYGLAHSARGSWRWALFTGIVFATATLTRPVALYLLPLVCLICVLGAADKRALTAVVLGASCIAPTGAWVIRNSVVADYTGISSIQEVNLLLYRAAGAISHDTGEDLATVQARLKAEAEDNLGPSPTVGAQASEYRSLAIGYIRQHPVGAAYVTARGVANLMFGPGGGTLQQLRTGLEDPPAGPDGATIVLLLALLVILCGSCIGLADLVRLGRWREVAIFAVLPLCLVAVSGGPEAYARFRVPIVPFLAILCGIAVSRVSDARSTCSTPATGSAVPTSRCSDAGRPGRESSAT